TFAAYVFGILRLGWGFNEMSGLFFAMGLIAGLVGRLGVEGTVEAYIDGFRAMAFAGLLIGFARAIFVVLDDGRVIDTIVFALVTPLEGLPVALAAFGMMGAHVLIHFPVPSVSGQAVLTMPVLVPMSDLLGLSRQVTVLAYQYGAGLTDLVTPTNGALMAVLIAAEVRYERWLRFVLPLAALLLLLGAIAVALGITMGLR
ncbi:MAG TPA: Na+/H+ antiporter NhaC family protein, partial [Longimicrobiaceae bacterium]